MADRKDYVIEVRTTHRMWGAFLRAFVPVMIAGSAWNFVEELREPGGVTRGSTWITLFLTISLLAFVLDEFFDVFHRRHKSAEVVAVRVAEDRAVVTDDKGQTVEFPWETLQDVVVVASGKQSTTQVILKAEKQTAFIPDTVRDSEELAAEILKRTGFVRVHTPLRDPGYRRYGREEASDA